MGLTAALYVRVSTSKQAASDLSIPDQIKQCGAYCDRLGWTVVDIFTEPGASALDDDRPMFQDMIYKATRPERPYDYVVVHSLSRFSRDALHSELYVRQLRKAGVELVSITQDVGQDVNGEFIRKVLNIFDEHQSRENAKHVHRAMLENARQGFWNGARPPFGYDVSVKEVRGIKEKKVLVVKDEEATVVQRIFDLALGALGRPLGVKAIASHLNDRAITRRGQRFSTGSIHEILTSTTYVGRHYFNRKDSRSGRARPPSQWVEFAVPAIIEETPFNAVQGLLRSRNPKNTPPRVVNGPTLLAGVARCGYCGSALIQNTGKGGAYRYYCCSRKLKEGRHSCRGIRLPMDRLDGIVIGQVIEQVLDPDRLKKVLEQYLLAAVDRADRNRDRIDLLRQKHRDVQTSLARLLTLVEQGVMEAEDPSLRERLSGLKLQRDELAVDIADLQKRLASNEPEITPERIERFAHLLREQLLHGTPEFRQAYARLVMSEVSVTEKEIQIRGSRDILAKAVSQQPGDSPPAVLTFVREWRCCQTNANWSPFALPKPPSADKKSTPLCESGGAGGLVVIA
ncbi:recombinase family protein [Tabrizicola sp. J26]|uniref:recombinase family protein n=1 Tax=Alitabrizicola rongguiensis TaxID=2909234 RepID=UPI001F2327C0|nr:recombinase family protein [Tabrizicola rongguiensis]MCF1709456.1 recombinase family protein [Tabrizicola rongguiensis]